MNASPRRALVTGGSGDIGSAVARALGAAGFAVIVHANSHIDRARDVAKAIEADGGTAS
ncbi:MAG: SDR family NAD(P)-dependent oxidoreductase, partial [Xanthomonadales bacterium]|nr:SDR family NAD(P)-dependent oxidoreductase [Xanthomonadales bacterium]